MAAVERGKRRCALRSTVSTFASSFFPERSRDPGAPPRALWGRDGVEVSTGLISRITETMLDEVRDWLNRPLNPVCPVVFFHALRVKIHGDSLVHNKAVYAALALNSDGEKEVLELWIEQTEASC
jgi:transposase-like protein